jgi:hypothetical protein
MHRFVFSLIAAVQHEVIVEIVNFEVPTDLRKMDLAR